MTHRKFRIWNGHKMEYNVMVGFLGVFYVEGLDKKDSACMSSFNTKYPDDVTEMESIGLLDNNGQEIWEGDIVKRTINMSHYTDGIGAMTDIFEVVREGIEILPFAEMGVHMEEYEVIGNVYENSELLK